MTKPIVSVAIMQLVEQKKISLNDSITKFLPQFSKLRVLKSKNSNINETVRVKKMPTIFDLLNQPDLSIFLGPLFQTSKIPKSIVTIF